MQWWKAEEVRRGELRAWFRRMTAWVMDLVENESHQFPLLQRVQACRFGNRCAWKTHFCPFAHQDHRPTPGWQQTGPTGSSNQAQAMQLDEPHPHVQQQMEDPVLRIPKAAATVWKATGDGAC